jgi:hypothetical protein
MLLVPAGLAEAPATNSMALVPDVLVVKPVAPADKSPLVSRLVPVELTDHRLEFTLSLPCASIWRAAKVLAMADAVGEVTVQLPVLLTTALPTALPLLSYT